jgi:thiol-disulfide isomerase/thioredoxin
MTLPHARLLTVVLSVCCVGFVAQAAEVTTLAIGAPAPDFSLPSVDGKTYSLADFSDADVLVIVFTCNHCPTAQAYEERIQQIATEYKDKGVTLIAITPNDPLAVRLDELGYTDVGDSFDDTKNRVALRGFTFPYLYDGDKQEVSKAYGPVATPHVFVFDKERKLRFAGRIDDNDDPEKVKSHDTRDAIDALLAGKPVPVETTKTRGCSIKWSDKRDSVQESLAKWAQEPVDLERVGADGIREIVKNDSKNLRLVNVWATWCGPCVAEFPELIEMNRMYRGRNFDMVTISGDEVENEENVLAFLKKNEASTRNYIYHGDDDYALIEAVDPKWQGNLPYTILIAPGGEIIYRHMSAIDPLEVKRAIVDYLGRTYN